MSKLFDLSGRAAIVTGSTRGIGRAIAEALVEQGAHVAISSRKQAACDQVASELNARHGEGRAIGVAASLGSKDELQALVDRTRDAFGQIDILVCNAASNPYFGSLSGISDDRFRKILDNNILANHWLIQMVLPEMVERRAGSVILISSIAGLKGSQTIGAYGVSKAADLQLVRNYAQENGRHNVRFNAIAPGLIKTDFAKALWDDPEQRRALIGDLPMDRVGEPEEIAGAAVFLASDAASYMTGQAIIIDGGATS
ncbi:SDR family NAD(P)-dependent oxidoreductase [Sphingomonas jatrophae]|uniref:NAD(P)-dependent dehydrogenase, short-chain alcohol dehydrogenase family n=1 Tax=Sphingomonas jatrophae TaxID=1166337 RepID=A0A1I6JNU9_9SPHN|nr:SDR family oxidoreductase [Sphingomonas jatrophae]SFR80220.1 NAD(P)-dependent dehydrogenase, short-chain alcohol dehydrogenase family [Sphingomonas jatrophae]